MELTLGNRLTLEDLPKPGETIYFDGFISKHATETLNIASMQTVTGKDVAVWAQVSTFDTEAVIVIDESPELFSVTVKDLEEEPLKEGIGNFPDEYGLTATVVKYNTQEDHPFYYGG